LDETPSGVRTYNLASQDRIVRGRMPTLEMINERFARSFRSRLFNLLRRSPVITVEGIQLVKFGEYVHTLLMPSNLNVIKIKPLRGTGLLVCNPRLIYSLVDCFFGGDGRFHTKIEGRDFTGTEMRIVRRIVQMSFESLVDAWEPVLPLQFEYVKSEVNPHFANIINPSEVVVVSAFHIDFDGGAGHLHVTLPYSMIEPIRELLDAGTPSESGAKDARWSALMQEEIKSAPIEINTVLATTEITVRDLINFKAGDVLRMELPDTALAHVDDVPLFRAKYGVSRGNYALQIVNLLRHADITPRSDPGAKS
ncbi:MAG: flagellar motor switch protein FliM, partial [Gammaproteobacteria bacterium]